MVCKPSFSLVSIANSCQLQISGFSIRSNQCEPLAEGPWESVSQQLTDVSSSTVQLHHHTHLDSPPGASTLLWCHNIPATEGTSESHWSYCFDFVVSLPVLTTLAFIPSCFLISLCLKCIEFGYSASISGSLYRWCKAFLFSEMPFSPTSPVMFPYHNSQT